MAKFELEKIARVIIDTDVIINWLTQERESVSGKELWKASQHIAELSEDKKINGYISILSVLEIRFLLRRKKAYTQIQIKQDVNKITNVFEVIVPDEIELLRANHLQAENPLDPFDAILLSCSLSLKECILVSRDKKLLKIASGFIKAGAPEEILERLLI